jgi:hypothetical protein
MTMWHRPILPLGNRSSLGACDIHKAGRAEYAAHRSHGAVFGSGLATAHARQLREVGRMRDAAKGRVDEEICRHNLAH